MRKKFLSMLLMIVVCLTGISGMTLSVNAEEGENIDYSYLLTDEALVGYAEMQTWGIYLSSGNSVINKISSTKIGAGGVTSAARTCKVSITSIVERQTNTGWAYVTAWTQTNENAYSAMISKSLTVNTGYYYRVRSSHYASTDYSSSWTDALWMGN